MRADDLGLALQAENALCDVIDPEIGRSVVEIGLIYGIARRGDTLCVTMTTTSRGCPAAGFLVEAVRERILAAGLAERVEVALTYDPPWTPDRMRD